MGFFQNKQDKSADEVKQAVEGLFDEALREELRQQSKAYFERVITENATLFKQDLDATVAHINTELRQHAARQLDDQMASISAANTELKQSMASRLDEQFNEFGKSLQEAQGLALQSIQRGAQALEEQHKQLGAALERSIANQDAMIAGAVEQNKARIAAMNEAEDAAIESLKRSIHELEQQHEKLNQLLKEGIDKQKAVLIETFENHMAQIVEHYLLNALGDQYDIRAQLPAIMKQLDENKQAIADDMKL